MGWILGSQDGIEESGMDGQEGVKDGSCIGPGNQRWDGPSGISDRHSGVMDGQEGVMDGQEGIRDGWTLGIRDGPRPPAAYGEVLYIHTNTTHTSKLPADALVLSPGRRGVRGTEGGFHHSRTMCSRPAVPAQIKAPQRSTQTGLVLSRLVSSGSAAKGRKIRSSGAIAAANAAARALVPPGAAGAVDWPTAPAAKAIIKPGTHTCGSGRLRPPLVFSTKSQRRTGALLSPPWERDDGYSGAPDQTARIRPTRNRNITWPTRCFARAPRRR